MSSPERIYRGSIRALSLAFIGLGLLILISTFAHGGGPISLGTLLGVAFLTVGVARLWLSGTFRGWRGGRGGSDG
ncbi:MAG TPA: hypothetical protein VLK89_09610 [Solirubrobacterales bacterium]|nr:hypothetical protein [Solirubrobacterales bacterium]